MDDATRNQQDQDSMNQDVGYADDSSDLEE